MYTLSVSKHFQKQLAKLISQNPKLKSKVTKTLVILNKNPNHPSLRLHKLSGQDIWSVSVNMSIRIIFGLRKDKIYLLGIGTHDEVY